MSITADQIVRLFEEDARARRRLAELLVSEPDVRLAIINAVLRDVATKHDIEILRKELGAEIAATKQEIAELRRELREDVDGLRRELRADVDRLEGRVGREIDRLYGEMDRLYRLVLVSILGILVSIATTIIARVLLP